MKYSLKVKDEKHLNRFYRKLIFDKITFRALYIIFNLHRFESLNGFRSGIYTNIYSSKSKVLVADINSNYLIKFGYGYENGPGTSGKVLVMCSFLSYTMDTCGHFTKSHICNNSFHKFSHLPVF